MTKEAFRARVQECAEFVRSLAPRTTVLLHHNDSDGLTSGSILVQALTRFGSKVRRYCLEDLYPPIVERVLSRDGLSGVDLVLVVDFGSGVLPDLAKRHSGTTPVVVLDHHRIRPSDDSRLFVVNPMGFGIEGSHELSASGVAYLFSKALSALNSDLAWIGALGAIGDGHHRKTGQLESLNGEIFDQAKDSTQMRFAEEYLVSLPEGERSAADVVSALDALGSFGYLRGGPDIGVKGLVDGFDERYFTHGASFEREFDRLLEDFESKLEYRQSQHIQWFLLPESFDGMGAKTVGLVCAALRFSEKTDPDKYIAGFQTVPREVPGLGKLDWSMTKLSMRLPKAFEDRVRAGEMPKLTDTVPPAARSIGGFVDACHLHAAKALVELGQEEALIRVIEEKTAELLSL